MFAVKHKLNKLLVLAFCAFGFIPLSYAEVYNIDPAHSFVVFKISHLGISTTVGQFSNVSGDIDINKDDISQSKVNVKVELGSLGTNHAERDKHLKGKDFFNIDKFTQATFETTSFKGNEKGGTLKGNLSFMGVTKPIEVEIKKVGEGKDPWGGYRIGFEGYTELNRKDYGIDYQMGPNTDTVKLEIFLEGIQS